MHLRWFFDQWTHLGGAPTVDATWSWADGELRVTLVRGDQPWVFPVEIEAGSETRTVWVDGDRVVAVIPMEEAPPYVAVDPRGGLLAKITTHQSEGMWLAQAQMATHPYAQLRAIEALKETGGEEAASWLLSLAEDTTQPYTMRDAALEALVDSPHAIHEGLGRLLKDEDPRVRKQAAGTLGAQAGNHAVAFEAAWRRERAPDVKAEVLKQWARHDRDAAVRDAETWLRLRRTSTVPNPVHTSALRVLGKHGEARHLDVVLQHVRVDRPHDVSYQAMASARQLVRAMPPGVDRKRAESKTSRAIEPLLDSAHLRTRAMAVQTLGAVGDDDAIRALKTFAKVATPSLSARADKAVTAIRKRDDDAPPQEDGELEARLLALEEEQKAQETRLKALEERR
jgi:HEAT repeat protein